MVTGKCGMVINMRMVCCGQYRGIVYRFLAEVVPSQPGD